VEEEVATKEIDEDAVVDEEVLLPWSKVNKLKNIYIHTFYLFYFFYRLWI